jgi:cobalt-zinc-cadmium efflux system membrane fusion protein
MNHDRLQQVSVLDAPPAGQPAARPALLGRLVAAVPNVLVLAALAGLAAWGHQTGWKLPRFSELTGQAAVETDDWCKAHAVPETICVECSPGLLPRYKAPGWCKIHGVHECPFEHPEIAQLDAPGAVAPVWLDRARRALALLPRAENARKCKLHLRRIQFASEEAVARAGIDVTPAWEGPITEAIAANGEVSYDQTRVARLSTRSPGIVFRVDRVPGQRVKKGDVLALIDAAEVGKAKGELLQAAALTALRGTTLQRLEEGLRSGSTTEANYRQAAAALQEAEIALAGAEQALANLGLLVKGDDVKGLSAAAARRRLQHLGLPDAVAAGLDAKTATANLLPVTSPLDGTVTAREVVAGEVVTAARTLLVVADTSRMWLTLHVRLEDARHLRLGQKVRFRPDGDDRQAEGKVAWISTAVDERTRTVKVRAELGNADGRLRASTFGAGRIVLREEPEALVVPSEAIQWEGDCHIVFVRDRNYLKKGSPKVFHTRTVRPGASDGGSTEVIAGLLPGELVVTRGSGVLRSELLKNNLGEG